MTSRARPSHAVASTHLAASDLSVGPGYAGAAGITSAYFPLEEAVSGLTGALAQLLRSALHRARRPAQTAIPSGGRA